jgi:hypothetical protein
MENQNKGDSEEASETKADLEEKVKIQQSKKQSRVPAIPDRGRV